MIQRIQSLFLLGVVLMSASLFFMPLSEKSVVDSTTGTATLHTLTVTGITLVNGSEAPQIVLKTFMILIVNLLLLALAAYTIFIYKKRQLQIKLCMLGGLLAAVQLILIFYYSENMGLTSLKPHYLAGVYLVAAQVLLFMAARRFIRKDDMLVRAADRIR